MSRKGRPFIYPWATWCAALVMCNILAQGQGRLLIQQNEASLAASEVLPVSESTGRQFHVESRPTVVEGWIPPYSWFQQQLKALAALEHVVLQNLNDGLDGNDDTSANTRAQQLRQVGCARMRAALLTKAAQQGSDTWTRPVDISVADSSSGSNTAAAVGDGEEYFEDDLTGRVSIRDAYMGADSLLRGTSSFGSDGSSSSGDADAARVAAAHGSRILHDKANFLWPDSVSGDDQGLYANEQDGVAIEWGDQYVERDEEFEYGYEYGYEYEYEEEADMDDADGDEDDEDDEDEEGWEQLQDLMAAKREGRNSQLLQGLSLGERYGLEGRVLKLLDRAYARALGGDSVEDGSQDQDTNLLAAAAEEDTGSHTAKVSATQTATTAESSSESLPLQEGSAATLQEENGVQGSVADAAGVAEEEAAIVSGVGTGLAAADSGYDAYGLVDPDDRDDGMPAYYDLGGDDDLYFGYEYDVYGDYYQAMNLVDVMLSKEQQQQGVDTDVDEWEDYLEQAYEYFTYYTEDNDDLDTSEYSSLYGSMYSNDVDAPSALAALASIAELVLLAHLGNFALEVRPVTGSSADVSSSLESTTGTVILISTEPYSGSIGDDTFSYSGVVYALSPYMQDSQTPAMLFAEQQWQSQEQPSLEVVHDLNMRFMLHDGSVNWGLVTMLVLSAGTLAMLVGFVVSWVALRRSMVTSSQGWVYVPPRKGGKGKQRWVGKRGCGDSGTVPLLLLRPEDVKGAVCWGATPPMVSAVEDASQYVLPKVENESVAKALCK